MRTGVLLSLVISQAAHLTHLYIAFKQELAFQDHVYSALSERKNMWNVWYNFELENISADKIFYWNNVVFEYSVYLEGVCVCLYGCTSRSSLP